MNIIDLTYPLHQVMPVMENDPPFLIEEVSNLKEQGFTLMKMEGNLHVGTHMDAPYHMLEHKPYLSHYPLEHFIGKGIVLDVRSEKVIEYKQAYEAIEEGSIVILCSNQYSLFDEAYYAFTPIFTEAFIDLLVRKHIKCIGIDASTVDEAPYPIHHRLLEHEIFIVENLYAPERLLELEAFTIYFIPLRIDAEASFIRAFAQYDEE